jgi:tetratricopeptide (TPR) repeat protein
MRRTIMIAAILGLVPLSALASMGGGGYGGGYGGGMGSAGGSISATGREEAETALRLIEKEDYADAIPHLKRALNVMQGNADILNYLGFTERMVGDYPDSLDYYQRALARNPDHKGAHEYLGELYLAMHQPDQARLQLAELDRLCPDGCTEKATLTQAIATYMAANPSTPSAVTPAAPPPAPPATPSSTEPAPSTPSSQQPAP